ncbi:MAG: D-hexose-6-phosphate mutarotase [Planctomycetota bacterium]
MAEPRPTPIATNRCATCGDDNACAIAQNGGDLAAGATCWCRAKTAPPAALQRIPDALRNQACLCSRCIEAAQDAPDPLPSGVRWITDPGGARPAIELTHADKRAVIATTGAQVLSFRDGGDDGDSNNILWTASAPEYRHGKPVRGGIPVVFPWFGDHRTDPAMPAHGFARSRSWRCTKVGPAAEVTLRLEDDEQTRALWPHAFRLELHVHLEQALSLSLTVTNRGPAPFRFEEALHTYFAVGDVHSTSVHGLEDVAFVEHAREPEASWDPSAPLRFAAETDRVFQDTPAQIVLQAPARRRTVTLQTRNAHSAIVWNPWPKKTARLSQMHGDDWRTFCCIESANVHAHEQTLAAGEEHTISLRLAGRTSP